MHRLGLLNPGLSVARTVAGHVVTGAGYVAAGAANVAIAHPIAATAVVGGAIAYRHRHAIGRHFNRLKTAVRSRLGRRQDDDDESLTDTNAPAGQQTTTLEDSDAVSEAETTDQDDDDHAPEP